MKRRPLAALEHRPWIAALLAAAGLTLLLPSAAALLLPTDVLDAAVALGEVRLRLGLGALFVVSAGVARLCLGRRRTYEEEEEELTAPVRLAGEGSASDPEAPARSYLR
jgi:hypothetical protein